MGHDDDFFIDSTAENKDLDANDNTDIVPSFDEIVEDTENPEADEKTDDSVPSFDDDTWEQTDDVEQSDKDGEATVDDVADTAVQEQVNTNETDTVTEIITRNESLEGDVHPITGVPFEREQIELPSGEVVEGVFPQFESVFDAHISEEMFSMTDYTQFKACNEQLYETVQNDPELRSTFTDEQIEQIRDGISDGSVPDGYVWHHDAECSTIQLVNSDIHAMTGHTGGRAVWGGGSDFR